MFSGPSLFYVLSFIGVYLHSDGLGTAYPTKFQVSCNSRRMPGLVEAFHTGTVWKVTGSQVQIQSGCWNMKVSLGWGKKIRNGKSQRKFGVHQGKT